MALKPEQARRGKPSTTTLPALLKAMQPTLKLILVLRSPMDRMYTTFMKKACASNDTRASPHAPPPASPQAFHHIAQASIELVKGCLKDHTARDCAARHMEDANELVQGMYSVYLPDWLDYFNQEEILILPVEEMERYKQDTILDMLQFLELDEPYEEELRRAVALPSSETIRQHETAPNPECQAPWPSMQPDTRYNLREFYKSFTKQLSFMLDDGRFNWLV